MTRAPARALGEYMLSTDTLLRDGRYRIGHAISSGQLGAIYTAEDQSTKKQVAVVVSTVATNDDDDNRIENLISLQHEGLVRIADNFQESGLAYKITEPVSGLEVFAESEAMPNEAEVAETFAQLSPIMLALDALRKEFSSLRFIEILPENIIRTADGKLKLLFIDTPGILFARNPPDSPYLPFERVWGDLDMISQRAFYREFDDNALESLEAPPDERSEIYSLGAVFYKLLTSRAPLTSFERACGMLDMQKDALQPLTSLNPAVSEAQSDFVMKILELRREDRFASLDEAILSLPSSSQRDDTRASNKSATETDDLDLLEIPVKTESESMSVATNGHHRSAPVLEDLIALSAMEVTAESASHTEELDSFVQQFYVEDRGGEIIEDDEITEEHVGFTASAPVAEQNDDAPVFSAEEAPQSSGFTKMIGFAAAGIVVVGVGGFGLLSLISSEGSESLDRPTAYQAPVTSISEPLPQPSPATEPTDQPVTTTNLAPQVVEIPADAKTSSKPRPQVAEFKVKPAETKPAAKQEQKSKKKITVDDLLN